MIFSSYIFCTFLPGLQGGVVFGGKLFYPTLAVVALFMQSWSAIVEAIDRETYGWEYVDPAAKNSRVMGVIGLADRVVRLEYVMFFALATFGLPKLDQDTELAPWLFLLPNFALNREVKIDCSLLSLERLVRK